MKFAFSRQMSEKYLTINFYKNPFGKSRLVPSGDGETNMAKLTVAFRNFAKCAEKRFTKCIGFIGS